MKQRLSVYVKRATIADMKPCTRCQKNPRRAPDQRLCRECHAEVMRAWRKTHRYVKVQEES